MIKLRAVFVAPKKSSCSAIVFVIVDPVWKVTVEEVELRPGPRSLDPLAEVGEPIRRGRLLGRNRKRGLLAAGSGHWVHRDRLGEKVVNGAVNVGIGGFLGTLFLAQANVVGGGQVVGVHDKGFLGGEILLHENELADYGVGAGEEGAGIGEGPVGVFEPLQRMDAGNGVNLLLPRQRLPLDVFLKFDGLEFLAGKFVGELDEDMSKAEFFVGDEAALTGDENTLWCYHDGVEQAELANGLGEFRDAGELLPLPIGGADD